MPELDQLLTHLKERGGSDLHLAAGLEPRIRIHGGLEPVSGWEKLSDERLRGLLRELASERHWASYEEEHDADFAYGLEGVARFRANFFVQENGAGAVEQRMAPREYVAQFETSNAKAIALAVRALLDVAPLFERRQKTEYIVLVKAEPA